MDTDVYRSQAKKRLGPAKQACQIVLRTPKWRRGRPLILIVQRSRSARLVVPADEVAKACWWLGIRPGRPPSTAVWESIRVIVCCEAHWLFGNIGPLKNSYFASITSLSISTPSVVRLPLIRARSMSDAARNRDAGRPVDRRRCLHTIGSVTCCQRGRARTSNCATPTIFAAALTSMLSVEFSGGVRFAVALRMAGSATVVDWDSFIRHQALLPEKREARARCTRAYQDAHDSAAVFLSVPPRDQLRGRLGLSSIAT